MASKDDFPALLITDLSSSAWRKSSSSSVMVSPLSDPESPYYIHHSDTLLTTVVTETLISTTYLAWRHAFEMAMLIRSKTGFLDGTLKRPADASDPLQRAWDRCNGLIVTWLLKSMNPTLANSFRYNKIASRIWSQLQKRFEVPDQSRICALYGQLALSVQGSRSLDDYYSEQEKIWEELRIYRPLPCCRCGSCDSTCFDSFRDAADSDRIYFFLNGLSAIHSVAKSQILLQRPLPSLEEVYNILVHDAKLDSSSTSSLSQELPVMAIGSGNRRFGSSSSS